MMCPNCKTDVLPDSNYCQHCGARLAAIPSGRYAGRRLMRSLTDCKIAGVCGGVAEYFGWDPTLVRVVWLVLTVCPIPFTGLIVYLACWLVMPVAPPPLTFSASASPVAHQGAQGA